MSIVRLNPHPSALGPIAVAKPEALAVRPADRTEHERISHRVFTPFHRAVSRLSSRSGGHLRSESKAPLRLLRKLRAISTAKPNLLPNPYSHNTWINFWVAGQDVYTAELTGSLNTVNFASGTSS